MSRESVSGGNCKHPVIEVTVCALDGGWMDR